MTRVSVLQYVSMIVDVFCMYSTWLPGAVDTWIYCIKYLCSGVLLVTYSALIFMADLFVL